MRPQNDVTIRSLALGFSMVIRSDFLSAPCPPHVGVGCMTCRRHHSHVADQVAVPFANLGAQAER
jgi:hypothetical protein